MSGIWNDAVSGHTYGYKPIKSVAGASVIGRGTGKTRDPRTLCSHGDVFSGGIGSQNTRGYQQRGSSRRSGQGNRIGLKQMALNAAFSGLVGGLTSTAFYGIDKAVGAVSESIAGNRRGRQQRIRENKSNRYQKASFWERLTKRKARVDELYANPLDEFSDPKIGPCESAVSRYIKQINQTGKVDNPIQVQKLSSSGYEIVNGHHRWLAAKKTGLESVPIRIKNYTN